MAEELGQLVWDVVAAWGRFERNTIGEQLVRAADSVGANIAEAYGRYHYGEKLRFLYFARGSLFETRFWLRQAYRRQLLSDEQSERMAAIIEPLAIGINNFANSVHQQRKAEGDTSKIVKEQEQHYTENPISQSPNLPISLQNDIFSREEISWLTNGNAS